MTGGSTSSCGDTGARQLRSELVAAALRVPGRQGRDGAGGRPGVATHRSTHTTMARQRSLACGASMHTTHEVGVSSPPPCPPREVEAVEPVADLAPLIPDLVSGLQDLAPSSSPLARRAELPSSWCGWGKGRGEKKQVYSNDFEMVSERNWSFIAYRDCWPLSPTLLSSTKNAYGYDTCQCASVAGTETCCLQFHSQISRTCTNGTDYFCIYRLVLKILESHCSRTRLTAFGLGST